ncbi:hypothetical protein K450DRAFT_281914 [Umbelopsis ramanniana AG]|uniref:CRIB domain-containing protein n=1 Tax=Umbelopsis ramanniana AG TaxID=1314678 RepID=A0AAD5E8I4_UMBRA|nr:uncharacterized protein K450DRAFT_281914 [Umbelopsis ramanniana AG]KAI8578306.1 hypothetical protein K450DRAFT_281914 [Umbelopsis ramanniana AG]
MGSSVSRIDDNMMSVLRQNYTQKQSAYRLVKRRKQKLSKSMIGQPSNFQHTHHIGSGDYQTNHIGVQEHIAEITVIFNATNKSTGISRKPVKEKLVDLCYVSNSNISTPRRVNRRVLLRQEPFKADMSQQLVVESNYFSKSTSSAIMSSRRDVPEHKRYTSLDMQKSSFNSLNDHHKQQLEMLKVDLEKLSRSEHNLRKYAACNHTLQIAPSRESFVC